jgi:phenylacetate-coenzyme A ligase PaaK-like adenylate-forming protein
MTENAMRRLKQIGDLLHALAIERRLRAHDGWTREELARHQRRELATLVRYAFTHSPFYRKLYDGLTLGEEIDLQALPVTNKRLIMENFDAVVTDPRLKLEALYEHLESVRGDEYYLGRYRVLATTGTSGLRGVFVYDRAAWSTVLANALRWNRFAGIEPRLPVRTRICTIGADHPMHVSERIPESADVGLFRMLRLTATDPLPKLVEALNAFQPHVLMPYPSVVALLADEQMAGRLRIRPEVVTTHSELLTAEMARRIEVAWGTKPFNHYGLSEEPHVGFECAERRGIHLLEDLCIVEVVDEDNRPVRPGVLGRKYLLTNLYNRVQPLIRYEVTDMLAKSPEPCPCGLPFPLVLQIGGRSEDILRLRDAVGREVAVPPMALTLSIEALPGVAEYQAAHDRDVIKVTVVPRPEADRDRLHEALQKSIRTTIETLGAAAPPIDVVFVERLERPRQRMGKIKLIGTWGGAKG